jgi:hypothetical protein
MADYSGYAPYLTCTFASVILYTTMGYTSMRYMYFYEIYFYKEFIQAPNKYFYKYFKQKLCKKIILTSFVEKDSL